MSCTRTSQELPTADGVDVGYSVLVGEQLEEVEYTVVHRGDVDVARGLISVGSPVGRALLGRRAGEDLVVQTPGGIRLLTIVRVIEPRETTAAKTAESTLVC